MQSQQVMLNSKGRIPESCSHSNENLPGVYSENRRGFRITIGFPFIILQDAKKTTAIMASDIPFFSCRDNPWHDRCKTLKKRRKPSGKAGFSLLLSLFGIEGRCSFLLAHVCCGVLHCWLPFSRPDAKDYITREECSLCGENIKS